mmetsp:Transcript_29350/g.94663  ORF Transcript_29350/g.94663 Transcript_29350/m.94663 type:complete len:218 (-) Transcript_29350:670-1323(-)
MYSIALRARRTARTTRHPHRSSTPLATAATGHSVKIVRPGGFLPPPRLQVHDDRELHRFILGVADGCIHLDADLWLGEQLQSAAPPAMLLLPLGRSPPIARRLARARRVPCLTAVAARHLYQQTGAARCDAFAAHAYRRAYAPPARRRTAGAIGCRLHRPKLLHRRPVQTVVVPARMQHRAYPPDRLTQRVGAVPAVGEEHVDVVRDVAHHRGLVRL